MATGTSFLELCFPHLILYQKILLFDKHLYHTSYVRKLNGYIPRQSYENTIDTPSNFTDKETEL